MAGVRNDFDRARAVFIGEPIARNELAIRMRVDAVWKGDIEAEVVMSTGAVPQSDGTTMSSSCDFGFVLGRTFVVFAYGASNETMSAQSCGFTGLLESNSAPSFLDRITPRRAPSPGRSREVVAVLGLVRSPGLVPYFPGMTVDEAVSRAGGAVPPPASLDGRMAGTSRVYRHRAGAPEYSAPLTKRTSLQSDDSLIVGLDLVRQDVDLAAIGVATVGVEQICAAIGKEGLQPGSEVLLISPGQPQRTFQARIRHPVDICPVLWDRNIDGAFYSLDTREPVPRDETVLLAIHGRPAVQANGNGVRLRLSEAVPSAQVRSCASAEGLHLTVWTGTPLQSQRLWHIYWYLGMDVEPTCVAGDYGPGQGR